MDTRTAPARDLLVFEWEKDGKKQRRQPLQAIERVCKHGADDKQLPTLLLSRSGPRAVPIVLTSH